MACRILLSDDKVSVGKAIRHTLAAGGTAFFVGQGLEGVEISSGLKMALLGISGAASTEIIDASIRWIKAKANTEIRKVGGKREKRAKRR